MPLADRVKNIRVYIVDAKKQAEFEDRDLGPESGSFPDIEYSLLDAANLHFAEARKKAFPYVREFRKFSDKKLRDLERWCL